MKPKSTNKSVGCCHHKRQSKLHLNCHHNHDAQASKATNPEGHRRTSMSDTEISDEDDIIDVVSTNFDKSCTVKAKTPNPTPTRAWNKPKSNGNLAKKPLPLNEGKNCSRKDCRHYEETLESIRLKRELLVERLRIYNNLLKFQKAVKEDQVYLYRKLQNMDELYLRNTAAILRLGFCHCLVHRQTSPVGDKLMKIHRKLRIWDKKVEDLCEVVKESPTRKTATAVLQILNICEESKLPCEAKEDFDDIGLPEIVWDLQNSFIEELNVSQLAKEWRDVKKDVTQGLGSAEVTFQEVCLVFGVTRGPEATPSTGRRLFSYDFDYTETEFNGNGEPKEKDEGTNDNQGYNDHDDDVGDDDTEEGEDDDNDIGTATAVASTSTVPATSSSFL